MELEQLFNSNYSLYIFFYLFGFISIYLIDKYIFPQENSTEKIYIIQESIEDQKNINIIN